MYPGSVVEFVKNMYSIHVVQYILLMSAAFTLATKVFFKMCAFNLLCIFILPLSTPCIASLHAENVAYVE